MKENDLLVIEKDNEKVECKILFTFECPETGKNYIGYTDNSLKDDERKRIYISSYDPICGLGKLEDVTSKEELDLVRNILTLIDER